MEPLQPPSKIALCLSMERSPCRLEILSTSAVVTKERNPEGRDKPDTQSAPTLASEMELPQEGTGIALCPWTKQRDTHGSTGFVTYTARP